MKLSQLQTPAVLLELSALERNLRSYSEAAAAHGKELWPMVKTHKCTALARLQAQYGCTGFLCGTLDELEALADYGFPRLMYAYPAASESAARRLLAVAEKAELTLRLDGPEAAGVLEQAAAEAGRQLRYTVIIDSGLHRFGVAPEQAGALAKELRRYSHLRCVGVSTHPGQVYACRSREEVRACAAEECRAVSIAAQSLREAGFEPELLTSGSTPTFRDALADPELGVYHPGNYIFHDVTQLPTGVAREEDCALQVLATIISHPREGLLICDAGAKCLGLDQGPHGNDSIKGYGRVVGHPELELFSLSEEVGKLHVHGPCELRVGDRIRIIPNHSCAAANLTSWFIGVRGEEAVSRFRVDLRGNSGAKGAEVLPENEI